MRQTPSFPAVTLLLCLAVGYAFTGCGDDEETFVEVDVELFCSESLRAMYNEDCMSNAYANVDDLKDCFVGCGPENSECLEGCLSVPGAGFSECSGDVEFLFDGECGSCYTECGFEFVGEESNPGCLFNTNPAVTGTDCLDALYACVEEC
jgi:hypothetical protein